MGENEFLLTFFLYTEESHVMLLCVSEAAAISCLFIQSLRFPLMWLTFRCHIKEKLCSVCSSFDYFAAVIFTATKTMLQNCFVLSHFFIPACRSS